MCRKKPLSVPAGCNLNEWCKRKAYFIREKSRFLPTVFLRFAYLNLIPFSFSRYNSPYSHQFKNHKFVLAISFRYYFHSIQFHFFSIPNAAALATRLPVIYSFLIAAKSIYIMLFHF